MLGVHILPHVLLILGGEEKRARLNNDLGRHVLSAVHEKVHGCRFVLFYYPSFHYVALFMDDVCVCKKESAIPIFFFYVFVTLLLTLPYLSAYLSTSFFFVF